MAIVACYESYLAAQASEGSFGLRRGDTVNIVVLGATHTMQDVFRQVVLTVMKDFEAFTGPTETTEDGLCIPHDASGNRSGVNVRILCGAHAGDRIVGKSVRSLLVDNPSSWRVDQHQVSSTLGRIAPALGAFGSCATRITVDSEPMRTQVYGAEHEKSGSQVLRLPTWLMNASVGLDVMKAEEQRDKRKFFREFGARPCWEPSEN
jgi:hypothetical protein